MVDHSKVLLVCTWQAQLLVQNREVPQSLFQFDCDLERRILAEAELQGHIMSELLLLLSQAKPTVDRHQI